MAQQPVCENPKPFGVEPPAEQRASYNTQGSDATGLAAPSFQQPLGEHDDPNAAPSLPPHDAKQLRPATHYT